MHTSRLVSVIAAMVMMCAPAHMHAGAIDEHTARECFDLAGALSEADGAQLWGIPIAGPMMFADPGSREVAANHADAEGALHERNGVWVGTLPEDVGIANTAIEWSGVRWSMVMWPPPQERTARATLLMHESFHRIQEDLGIPAASPDNNHLDTRDGRIWLQMEWRALAQALLLGEVERKGAIEDALIFRMKRRSMFEGAAESERQLELNEGLAEYTGYRLCGLPLDVLPARVVMRLTDAQGQAGYVRNFAYVSGPAYGLLLDAANPSWRSEVHAASDLGDMLAAAIGAEIPGTLDAAAMERASKYHGESLIADETRRDQAHQVEVAANRQRFVDGPVLVIPLTADVSYTFDPNAVQALDASGAVYRSLRIVDAWGVLEAPSGALLIRKDGKMVEAHVPAPADIASSPLAGDGWTLKLNNGWHVTTGAREGDFVLAAGE